MHCMAWHMHMGMDMNLPGYCYDILAQYVMEFEIQIEIFEWICIVPT